MFQYIFNAADWGTTPEHGCGNFLGLLHQLVEPVRWEGTISGLIKEAKKEQLFELGPGAQIKAMVKRIDMSVWKAMRNVSV